MKNVFKWFVCRMDMVGGFLKFEVIIIEFLKLKRKLEKKWIKKEENIYSLWDSYKR